MREIICIVALYVLLKLDDINTFFFIATKVIAFFLILYILFCVSERFIIGKRNWFRATPGTPQVPEFNDKISNEEKRRIREYEKIGGEKHYTEDGLR